MSLFEMVRLTSIAMLGVGLVAGIAWGGIAGGSRDAGGVPATQSAKPPATRPAADLSPEQVVRAVVGALRKNDADDNGIRITFGFASPGNKEVTGPIDRFIPLVKNPAYAPLINHQSAEFGPLDLADAHAEQLVVVTTSAGEKAYFVFQLSRQGDGEFKDCWMTDGVFRVQPANGGDGPPQPQRPDGGGPIKT